MLNVGFVDNYYLMITQDNKEQLKHTLIIGNITKCIKVTFKAIYNKNGYMVFNIKELKEKIPKKCFNKLLNRGLFKNKKKREYNTFTSIHRLVYCINDNCIDKEIHHINKDKSNNTEMNLVSLTGKENKEMEQIKDSKEFKKIGFKIKDKKEEEKEKKIKKKKSYKANNDKLQMEIIKYAINHTTKETIKRYKKFIRTPQKIREIINFYYFKGEFLEWLKYYDKGTLIKNIDIKELV